MSTGLSRTTNPYWLVREPGKTVGFGAVDFEPGDSAADALRRFVAGLEPAMRELLAPVLAGALEVVLCTLTYVDELPKIGELSTTTVNPL